MKRFGKVLTSTLAIGVAAALVAGPASAKPPAKLKPLNIAAQAHGSSRVIPMVPAQQASCSGSIVYNNEGSFYRDEVTAKYEWRYCASAPVVTGTTRVAAVKGYFYLVFPNGSGWVVGTLTGTATQTNVAANAKASYKVKASYDFTLTITGGTGQYKNAKGEMKVAGTGTPMSADANQFRLLDRTVFTGTITL